MNASAEAYLAQLERDEPRRVVIDPDTIRFCVHLLEARAAKCTMGRKSMASGLREVAAELQFFLELGQ